MSSLGKLTKKAFLKGANDGAPARNISATLTDVKGAGKEGKGKTSRANDNAADGPKFLAKVQEEDRVMAKLLELVDAGDTFALNKYAKKHFGKSWTKLKNDPAIKDMI